PVRTGYDGEGDGLFWNGTGAVEGPLLGGQLRVNGRLNTDGFKGEELTHVFTTPARTEQNVYIQDTDETEIGVRYTRKFGGAWDGEFVGLRQTRDRGVLNLFTDSSASRFQTERDTVETIGRA